MEGIVTLANKNQYSGQWHGDFSECSGELIFYTGMGNLLEFISDPANFGKIIVTTFPGILNSTINIKESESADIQLSGLVIQQEPLANNAWLKLFQQKKISVISGVDTRAIVKEVLENGEMEATITANETGKSKNSATKNFEQPSYVGKVFNPLGSNHAVVLDFGIKKSLINWLLNLDFKLTIVAGAIKAAEVKELNPDILVFSGGPNEPKQWNHYFNEYKNMAKNYPTVGFGLGHQILATAFGASIMKMKWGHRSFKHPIIHLASNQVFMSNQNHGFTVSEKELDMSGFSPAFYSVQDGSIDGLIHQTHPITTYQFHPDGSNAKLEAIIKDSIFKQLKREKGVKLYA